MLLVGTKGVFAYHIIGGEMYYDRLDGNNFRITLKLYRDCSAAEGAPYDDPLQIYVYNASGVLVDSLVIPFPGSITIDPDLSDPCMTSPPDVCVQEAIYSQIINLPNSAGGYDLVYQRCCRNSTIINIVDPLYTGATYTEHIPDPVSIDNSSPRFDLFPPIVICGNYPFSFDHSATDPDGDVLVYEWFNPFTGASYDAPDPAPALGPPFYEVNYAAPYSYTYPIESSPVFTLNSSTGWLAGTPTAFGQYVVGIAVKEYRAGVLIGTHYRDFQFNITDCEPAIVAALPDEINECQDFTVHFENLSYGTDTYYWDFGIDGITTDVSDLENPSYTYPDTGTYEVMLIAFPGETCSDTTYATVQVYPHLIADMGFENTCAQNDVAFSDLSTSDFGDVVAWQWNYGDGGGSTDQNPFYAYDEPGDYLLILTVENSYGCEAEIYDTIKIYPLPYPSFITDDACIQTIGTVTSTSVIIFGNDIVDLQWEMEPDAYFSGESFDYYFDTAGIYTVHLEATSNFGCTDSITDEIIVPENVVAGALPDTIICEGDSVYVNATGGYYYSWYPAENISDPNIANPFLFPDASTTYHVIVSDECTSDTSEINIQVLAAPDVISSPDTIVYHDHPVQLWVTGAAGYEWTPPAGLDDNYSATPIALPDQTTLYIVEGTDKDGCSAKDSTVVYIIPVCFRYTVVNAFSPNGDGLNDNFRFITSGDDELTDLSIYNRWGEKIFYTNDPVKGWDGNDLTGKPQEIGSYIYTIETVCDGISQSLSGSVTLLR